MTYVKTRYQRSTKGENAEVYVGNPVAYTTQATVALFETNAVEGEVGIYDAVSGALYGASAVLAAPANPSATTSIVGGAVPAQTSFYKVVAYNAAGNSGPSVEFSVVSTGSTSSNELTWNDVPGATSYRVYRGTVTNTQTGYQTTADNSFLDQSATAGTAGTVPTASGSVPAPLVAGTNYQIAMKQDGKVILSTKITYDGTRTRRTPYIAPVKQVTTINIPAAVVTYNDALIAAQTPFSIDDNINYAGLTTIETTPGNEPYPTIDWDYEFSNPAGVTTSSILTKIVARISNPLDVAQKDDGQQYTATVASDGSGGFNVVVTAFYFGQHFRIALRGLLSQGTITYTTPFIRGSGDSTGVSFVEREGWAYAGVPLYYGAGIRPEEFGEPTAHTVSGLTYNWYQLDPLRISKEPMPQSVHHHYAHIYIIVPVPVGGSTGARAASSPDYILGTVLGFTLTP